MTTNWWLSMKIYNSNVHIAVNMRYISFVNDLPFASYRVSADFGIFFLNNPLCKHSKPMRIHFSSFRTGKNARNQCPRCHHKVLEWCATVLRKKLQMSTTLYYGNID